MEDLIALGKDAEVLVGWRIPTQIYQHAPKLRYICYFHAGCDALDLVWLHAHDVQVASSAGANAGPVAEHAFALMLGLAKRLVFHHGAVARAEWNRDEDETGLSAEPAGETLAVIGFGQIGQAVAKRSKAFDLRVIAVRRTPTAGAGPADEVLGPNQLHAALARPLYHLGTPAHAGNGPFDR
jgi:phosphoglycerate dehydrogenase-like enzyme